MFLSSGVVVGALVETWSRAMSANYRATPLQARRMLRRAESCEIEVRDDVGQDLHRLPEGGAGGELGFG